MRIVYLLLLLFVIGVSVYAVPVTDGLIIHLDAGSIIGLNDGDPVNSWTDLATADSVNGNVEAVPGWNAPIYQSNGLNGNAVVRMQGGDLLASGSLTFPNVDNGLTVFIVAQGDQSGQSGERVLQIGRITSSNRGKCLGIDFSTDTSAADGGSGGRFNNGKSLVRAANPVTPGFHMVAAQIDQGETYGSLRYYVDDITAEVFDNSANPGNTIMLDAGGNELTIGTGIQPDGGYFTSDDYQGDIAEILIYNSQLNPDQIQQVFDYFHDRYFAEDLIIHLDASSLSGLNNGDVISNWPDLAANDPVDGTVMPVTGQATYRSGILNGHAVVRLDGSSYLASNLLTLPSVNNGLTIFVVATGDQSGDSAERAMQFGQASSNAGHILGVDLSTNTGATDGGSGGRFNNGKSLVKAGNPVSAGFHIAILQMGQGQPYSALKYYVDDLDQEEFNNTANPDNIFTLLPDDNKFTVGNGIDSSGNYYASDIYQGDVAEIRIYNAQLSLSQMRYIFDSLYERYLSSLIDVSPALLNLTEGQTDAVNLSLKTPPDSKVTVKLQDLFEPKQVNLDPAVLEFSTDNWNQSQSVQVTAVDDMLLEAQYHSTTILLSAASTDLNYDDIDTSIQIKILENECGRWAYPPGDFNEDCKVNLLDFLVLATQWLWCDPMKDDLCKNLN